MIEAILRRIGVWFIVTTVLSELLKEGARVFGLVQIVPRSNAAQNGRRCCLFWKHMTRQSKLPCLMADESCLHQVVTISSRTFKAKKSKWVQLTMFYSANFQQAHQHRSVTAADERCNNLYTPASLSRCASGTRQQANQASSDAMIVPSVSTATR